MSLPPPSQVAVFAKSITSDLAQSIFECKGVVGRFDGNNGNFSVSTKVSEYYWVKGKTNQPDLVKYKSLLQKTLSHLVVRDVVALSGIPNTENESFRIQFVVSK